MNRYMGEDAAVYAPQRRHADGTADHGMPKHAPVNEVQRQIEELNKAGRWWSHEALAEHDREVAKPGEALLALVMEAIERLRSASVPLGMTEGQAYAGTIRDTLAILQRPLSDDVAPGGAS